ncbi:MAG: AMP-binding protein, partial [Proteobacteria bacterium]|nr:AMP-binding protein [Pseudomonadota bacterium]
MGWAEKTVGQVLDDAADRFPERDALVYVDRGLRYSYREFRERVDLLARGLLALGVEKGEHVALWAMNLPEWVLLQFATAKVGAVLVTVNTNYQRHELRYVLEQSDVTTLFLAEGYRDVDCLAALYDVAPEVRDPAWPERPCSGLPRLRRAVFLGEEKHPGTRPFAELYERGREVEPGVLEEREAQLSAREPINMQYTSGTTGFPKGVLLSHFNIVNNALAQGQVMGFTEQDRLCIPVPFFHCFGCVMSTLLCVCYGAAMVPVEAFDPALVLRSVEEERCTALHGVPTMFIALLNHPDFPGRDLTSLRTGIMAGAPCPVELMRRVLGQMHMTEICITYGQTEASPGITMTRRDDSVERRVATVGRALPGVEVKIVDPETSLPVPAGTQGELCSRGYNTMLGYYRMPEASGEAVDGEGWLHTGDLATMDDQGYCKITGRLKNMIIRGGENLFPREIEEFLYTHPDVLHVEVLGVPDLRYGEQVLAAIIPREGKNLNEEQVKVFCRGR